MLIRRRRGADPGTPCRRASLCRAQLTRVSACSKVISPVFEKLADAFPALGFYKVDVDTQEVRSRASTAQTDRS